MFLKYIDFIFAPFRAINNKIIGVKNIKGNIQVDVNRSKSLLNRGKRFKADANAKLGYPPQGQQQQGGQAMQQQMPGMPGMPQMPPGAPGAPAPGAPSSNPPVRTEGFWIFKKKFCTQCAQQLDKSWDSCPFCAQIAQQVVAAPAKLQALKTQAFVLDQSGNPGQMQLLGWLVPLQGHHRGELMTLQPKNVIGNGSDATVTLVLQDKFMSGKHAEIVAENGLWILRDIGSTNGTYVNNRRVDRHELVDNDFIKFGSAMLKFKSL